MGGCEKKRKTADEAEIKESHNSFLLLLFLLDAEGKTFSRSSWDIFFPSLSFFSKVLFFSLSRQWALSRVAVKMYLQTGLFKREFGPGSNGTHSLYVILLLLLRKDRQKILWEARSRSFMKNWPSLKALKFYFAKDTS